MTADHFVAELVKLAKRPASWIMAVILLLSLGLFGYLFIYVFAASVQRGDDPQSVDADTVLEGILPGSVLLQVLSNITGIGAAVALVFGALVVGSEYGWGTLKQVLIQSPGRLQMLWGKILAIGAAIALLTVALFSVGFAASTTVSILQDKASEWPSVWETLRAFASGWLILSAWASLGALLATVFRGTSLAIGVGLAYALVIEGLALSLPIQGETFQSAQKILLSKNATDLVSAFGELPAGVESAGEPVGPGQAAAVITAYIASCLLISTLLMRKRDV